MKKIGSRHCSIVQILSAKPYALFQILPCSSSFKSLSSDLPCPWSLYVLGVMRISPLHLPSHSSREVVFLSLRLPFFVVSSFALLSLISAAEYEPPRVREYSALTATTAQYVSAMYLHVRPLYVQYPSKCIKSHTRENRPDLGPDHLNDYLGQWCLLTASDCRAHPSARRYQDGYQDEGAG